MPDTIGAVIVAAGSGARMAGADKLFTEIGGRPLLAHALAAFQDCAAIDRMVLVMSPLNLKRGRELVERCGFAKAGRLVGGGARRQDSVRLGLEALGPCDYVAVHDGARPLVTPELIERGIEAARDTGAAAPAIPIADTVKEVDADGLVVRTLDRSRLWAVQTPQVIRYDLLLRAHREVTADVTDDAAMVEALGEPVRLFEGSRTNIKVTTVEDLDLVRAYLDRDRLLLRSHRDLMSNLRTLIEAVLAGQLDSRQFEAEFNTEITEPVFDAEFPKQLSFLQEFHDELAMFEADDEARREHPGYFGEQRLKELCRSVLNRLYALMGEVA